MDILVVDGAKFIPWTPKDEEKEFHPFVKSQSKRIFGEDTIYFDVKTALKTASGIVTIPDAYVIDLAAPNDWYVVENELSTHSVYDHIVKQLTKFINGIENQKSRLHILDLLYAEINKDNTTRKTIIAKTGNVDVYNFLSKLFSKEPIIVVIIDEITPELEEACHALKVTPDIVEFKTFVKADNPNSHAHLFEPFYEMKKPLEGGTASGHTTGWTMMFEGIDESIREATTSLIARMNELGNVVYKGKRSCSAYIGQQRVKYGFVGLVPTRSALKVIIRADSAFSDPRGWVNAKAVNWFTSREERKEKEFQIMRKDQIEYAMELIRQSYQIVKSQKANGKQQDKPDTQ